MKRNAFILVETIVVISIFITVSLLIGNLIISSLRMLDHSVINYNLESDKNNTIILLSGDNFDTNSATLLDMNYTRKIAVVYCGATQKGIKKYDIIWKK